MKICILKYDILLNCWIAFDVTNDGVKALEEIIEIGFDRVLTSGMQPTALEGLPNLKEIVEQVLYCIKIQKTFMKNAY